MSNPAGSPGRPYISNANPALITAVSECVTLLNAEVESIRTYEWTGPDDEQFWEFYKRSIIIRQHEGVQAILEGAKGKFGQFGVTLLRPAYEELLWAYYLEQHADKAPEIIRLLTTREVEETLDAQNQYLGARMMQEQGFTQKYLKRRSAISRLQLTRLKTLGKQLGWRNDEPPGAAFVARAVGKEREYNFIYSATSRYVHFSTHELGRRVWGKSGKVAVGSDPFSAYWKEFAVYWSLRIFIDTLRALGGVFSETQLSDTALHDKMMINIPNIRPIPIIAKDELENW
jgi:hypothetical protein